jgi:hypothetical protein
MTCENLEKVEFIGNWFREGHIKRSRQGGRGLIPVPCIDGADYVQSGGEYD